MDASNALSKEGKYAVARPGIHTPDRLYLISLIVSHPIA
jgi:hypothetical protein